MRKNKLKIAVTGARGFIGSNVLRALRMRDAYDIFAIDTHNKEAFLRQRFDVIIHLGALTDTQETDMFTCFERNTLYSKKLFDYCVTNHTRLIYASSGATYGLGENGFSDNTIVLKPTTPYGYSKYLFDRWVLATPKKPVQCVGLKFFNVYGPGEDHKGPMASVVFHGFQQIKKSGYMKLFKYGKQKRDFVYIDDVVDVILFFLDHPKKNGMYNVGTGKARTFLDLAHATFAALGKKSNVRFIDMPKSLRPVYQEFTQADIAKLRKVGYKKEFKSIEEGTKIYARTKNY